MSALALQVDRYHGARERLWGSPGLPRSLPAPRVQIPPPPHAIAPFNFLARPAPKAIIKLVSLKHGVSVDEIMGPSRSVHLVAARHLAIWLVHTHCRWLSTPEVGRIFGRDHTTVLNALRKFAPRPTKVATIRCPCCGTAIEAPPDAQALKSLPLGGSEAELLGYYVDAYPKPLSTERVVSLLWQLDPGGGPLTPNAGISVRVHNINAALKPYGWAIRRNGNSARRLVRLGG